MRGTRHFDEHAKPTRGTMVPADAFKPLIQDLVVNHHMTWTHIQMACGVSKDTLSKIAWGHKHYVQSATAERLRGLLELFPDA